MKMSQYETHFGRIAITTLSNISTIQDSKKLSKMHILDNQIDLESIKCDYSAISPRAQMQREW